MYRNIRPTFGSTTLTTTIAILLILLLGLLVAGFVHFGEHEGDVGVFMRRAHPGQAYEVHCRASGDKRLCEIIMKTRTLSLSCDFLYGCVEVRL